MWSPSEWEVMVICGGTPSAISMVTRVEPTMSVDASFVERPRVALKVWGV